MNNNKALERLRTAGILVNVYGAGGGKVRLSAENVGPISLTAGEMSFILKEAADQLAEGRGYIAGAAPQDN